MSYDLEDRTFDFALASRDFCRKISWDIINKVLIEEAEQLRKIFSAIIKKLE